MIGQLFGRNSDILFGHQTLALSRLGGLGSMITSVKTMYQSPIINPRRACGEGYGTWSVCLCLSVCTAPRVCHYAQRNGQPNSGEGTYGFGAIWKIWRFLGLFWFFQSQTAGYKLPGRVRQRATSLFLHAIGPSASFNACKNSRARAKDRLRTTQRFLWLSEKFFF